MNRARLVPISFDEQPDEGFAEQVRHIARLLTEEAELLEPVALGHPLPACDAVVFPQLLGDAYRRVEALRAIDRPLLIITSEFGTLSMWDWELIDYLRGEGIETLAPYDLEQSRLICRALYTRQMLARSRFLVFQDNPGDGAQAPIFKRFYWWEDECTQRLREAFGVKVEKYSYRELGEEARAVSDAAADDAARSRGFTVGALPQVSVRSAMKLYLALKSRIESAEDVAGVGINCLNESHHSDTTPCLAWDLLYEDRQLIWGCEADTMAMTTKALLLGTLGVPLMMTNLYPFLMGQAALKHERIDAFPQVEGDPANHLLVAHCGYMGVIPRAFSTRWSLKPKALAIVDDNAHAIDADLPVGPITLAKLHPTMNRMTVAEGTLKGYAAFPGSDCLNGGVIEVADGRKLMGKLASHHYLLLVGHQAQAIRWVGRVFGFEIDPI